ncbi:MAG: alpha/beta hydrolase [Proteobacteria bacterium]|nr:alpha/beta hydrolase [Pseudomonadota bacterium]
MRKTIHNANIELSVDVEGSGPLILCVHGWPELSYSWRHQQAHFAQIGYTVAAMDVRGYGESSKPEAIAAYTLNELAADVAAVAAGLSDDPVILFGHDWGAPIVYNTALRYPDQIRAVAGLSVPYLPAGPTSSLDMWKALYADRFFYQLYFQAPGVVEAEIQADLVSALRKIYFALSGDAPLNEWLKHKPADAALLDDLSDPYPFPAWMTGTDMAVYTTAFEKGGFIGPFNRYRAQTLDVAQGDALVGRSLTQPTCFIAGERDAVRNFIPGADLYADPGAACDDFRGATLIPGAGHWVQQEAPAPVNQALAQFLLSLRK